MEIGNIYLNTAKEQEILSIFTIIDKALNAKIYDIPLYISYISLQCIYYDLYNKTKTFKVIRETEFDYYVNNKIYEEISFDEFIFVLNRNELNFNDFELTD